METMIKRQGRVTLAVRSEYDDSPDTSWLGEAVAYREAVRTFPQMPIYSREIDAILLPGSGVWKDRKGRITASPNLDGHWARDWDFLSLAGAGDGYASETKDRLKYLFQDADRLITLYRGDWGFIGIVATVNIDGREIGNASVWGFESDSGDYLKSEARNIAQEAIRDAKTFLASLKAS